HPIGEAELTAEEIRLESVELLHAVVGYEFHSVGAFDPGHAAASDPTVHRGENQTVRRLAAHAGHAGDIHAGEAIVLYGVIVGAREAQRGHVEALGDGVGDAVGDASAKAGGKLADQGGREDGVGRGGGVVDVVLIRPREVYRIAEGIHAETVAFDLGE